uniref:CCHC-type domain-containing protein n=1 Tax=Rhodnius prolixus TaxID=13249 RepID=T1HVY1_RHOPR
MEVFTRPSEMKFEGNLAENWRVFRRDLDIFLKAANITDAKGSSGRRTAVLLNFIGSKGKELYYTFTFAEGENENFDVVLEKFEQYVEPQKNLVLSSFLFNSRNQKANESFDTFVTELKNLVNDCEYKQLADRLLMDRIVQGVREVRLREAFLREKELTLQKAIEIGRTAELSREQANVMNLPEKVDYLNRATGPQDKKSYKKKIEKKNFKPVQKSENVNSDRAKGKNISEGGASYSCKKCGNIHKRANCPAFGRVCAKCGKKNHFAIGCKIAKFVRGCTASDGLVID